MANVHAIIEAGIEARRIGKKVEALKLFEKAIELDDYNEIAWLWLSTVVDTSEEKITCLENVLVINPNNEKAKDGIIKLKDNQKSNSQNKNKDNKQDIFGLDDDDIFGSDEPFITHHSFLTGPFGNDMNDIPSEQPEKKTNNISHNQIAFKLIPIENIYDMIGYKSLIEVMKPPIAPDISEHLILKLHSLSDNYDNITLDISYISQKDIINEVLSYSILNILYMSNSKIRAEDIHYLLYHRFSFRIRHLVANILNQQAWKCPDVLKISYAIASFDWDLCAEQGEEGINALFEIAPYINLIIPYINLLKTLAQLDIERVRKRLILSLGYYDFTLRQLEDVDIDSLAQLRNTIFEILNNDKFPQSKLIVEMYRDTNN